MVINSLNLKLRQIVRFSSNVILDEMSSAFWNFFWIAQHEERPPYNIHNGNFSLILSRRFDLVKTKKNF